MIDLTLNGIYFYSLYAFDYQLKKLINVFGINNFYLVCFERKRLNMYF